MSHVTHELVLEVLEGCAHSALEEAQRLGPARAAGPTELVLTTEDLDAVRGLRRVVAASTSMTVPARRPRELLDTSVQQRIGDLLADIGRQRPRQRFTGLRLEAAGSHTPDMRRLADAFAEQAGVEVDEDGDLVVRVRRGAGPGTWQVLLRTTPRPLSTRAWRTVDYPGAVNATIAATVLDLLEVGAEDHLLDMTCGSGTFLIEQLAVVAPARTIGVDLNPAAIDAARQHQRAARRRGRIDWITGDVLTTDLDPGFTRLLTNPPWGTLHGEHESNERLLADLLDRGAELAAPEARMGVLTHEITRMHRVLERPGLPWRPVGEHRFFQKGHHPRLFLLERG
ncbi:methyltransferase domain-containing protein [Brachybacterium sp. GCM10030267]|uniref:methyltransferase domain-containing protein n=1 Tax=Brachybacterium sp. GCM10030267 TaxID=3273381 RepID=UPI00360A00A3